MNILDFLIFLLRNYGVVAICSIVISVLLRGLS